MENQQTLRRPATANFISTKSVAEIADCEGWSPDRYAIALSENIRDSRVGLDAQRERLAALASVGAGLTGDQTSAEELARHFAILESLFHRFARQAHEALKDDRPRASEVADRFFGGALRAQRASMATLSALKVLRDEHRTPSRSAPVPVSPPPAIAPTPVVDSDRIGGISGPSAARTVLLETTEAVTLTGSPDRNLEACVVDLMEEGASTITLLGTSSPTTSRSGAAESDAPAVHLHLSRQAD